MGIASRDLGRMKKPRTRERAVCTTRAASELEENTRLNLHTAVSASSKGQEATTGSCSKLVMMGAEIKA